MEEKITQGYILKQYREQNGYTVEALAEKINVSRNTVTNWETNRTEPGYSNLLDLSKLYNISLNAFSPEKFKSRNFADKDTPEGIYLAGRAKLDEMFGDSDEYPQLIKVRWGDLVEIRPKFAGSELRKCFEEFFKKHEFDIAQINSLYFTVYLYSEHEKIFLKSLIREMLFKDNMSYLLDMDYYYCFNRACFGDVGDDYSFLVVDETGDIQCVGNSFEEIEAKLIKRGISEERLYDGVGFGVYEFHEVSGIAQLGHKDDRRFMFEKTSRGGTMLGVCADLKTFHDLRQLMFKIGEKGTILKGEENLTLKQRC